MYPAYVRIYTFLKECHNLLRVSFYSYQYHYNAHFTCRVHKTLFIFIALEKYYINRIEDNDI
jgi:hypothetical protein